MIFKSWFIYSEKTCIIFKVLDCLKSNNTLLNIFKVNYENSVNVLIDWNHNAMQLLSITKIRIF